MKNFDRLMIQINIFLTFVVGAMAVDYMARSPSLFTFKKRMASKAKVMNCDADFDGDKREDDCKIITTPKNIQVEISLKNSGYRKHTLPFAVGKKAQNTFCRPKISVSQTSPVLPVHKFCPASNNSPACAKLRAANQPLVELDKRGGKGILLSDGTCNKIQVHWNEARRKIDWWQHQ